MVPADMAAVERASDGTVSLMRSSTLEMVACCLGCFPGKILAHVRVGARAGGHVLLPVRGRDGSFVWDASRRCSYILRCGLLVTSLVFAMRGPFDAEDPAGTTDPRLRRMERAC
jgi:hypothetical protein